MRFFILFMGFFFLLNVFIFVNWVLEGVVVRFGKF